MNSCICQIHCNRGCDPSCEPCSVPIISRKAYIGIDPGKTGALALISRDLIQISIYEAPTMSVGKKNEYDLVAIKSMLTTLKTGYELKAAIELVHSMPGQGVTSMFSMGYGFGIWRMALVALDIPHELVTPQAWKKMLMAGQPKDKQASVLVASQLYPQAYSQLIGPKGGKKDGNADALLIAEWLRRTNP